MKFVIAPDSFKGCMTAKQAGEAIRAGLLRVFPDAEYVMVPMADGGEGTVRSLVDATQGHMRSAKVLNPLQFETTAEYGILGNTGDEDKNRGDRDGGCQRHPVRYRKHPEPACHHHIRNRPTYDACSG